MKPAPNESVVEWARQEFGEPTKFTPRAYYNSDGDIIEFLVSNEAYYARRIDGWVTVYHAESNDELVGGLIKSVRGHLLKKFPGLKIDFVGNKVRVECLLRAQAWQTGDELLQRTYKDLIERTGSISAEMQPV